MMGILTKMPTISIKNKNTGRVSSSLCVEAGGLQSLELPGDRSTVIGNPFLLTDEFYRGLVCQAFEDYFYLVVRDGKEPSEAAEEIAAKNSLQIAKSWIRPDRYVFMAALTFLEKAIVKDRNNIILGCYCFPKKCHLITVAKYIKNKIETTDPYLRSLKDGWL